jgi:hypothetical protein
MIFPFKKSGLVAAAGEVCEGGAKFTLVNRGYNLRAGVLEQHRITTVAKLIVGAGEVGLVEALLIFGNRYVRALKLGNRPAAAGNGVRNVGKLHRRREVNADIAAADRIGIFAVKRGFGRGKARGKGYESQEQFHLNPSKKRG